MTDPVLQRTEAWYTERASGVTSTDIPAILGLSPWASEADVARAKQGEPEPETTPEAKRRMRLGLAMESIVAIEDELEHGIPLRHVDELVQHPTIPWAMTSLDYERTTERAIVEVKTSASRSWDDGLPEMVEAQVRWQMGVASYPKAHVAALRFGSELSCYDLDHDQGTFDNLVLIATDFRLRLAAGGPFAENSASVKRRWSHDTGATMRADPEVAQQVGTILQMRGERDELDRQIDDLETQIKQTMQDVSTLLVSKGIRVTWKRRQDSVKTDYRNLAHSYRLQLDALAALGAETGDLDALESIYTDVQPGSRVFRIWRDKEREES